MKIAIAAYGVEGQASYRYYSKDPTNDVTIFDQNPALVGPEGATIVLGTDAFEKLGGYELILRSPPIAPYHLRTDGKIWSATNEFFAKCPADIIGVTGTKGKGTTASLIASILEAAGQKVWLVGNIGVPALDILEQVQPSDVVVYELSSFQLWDLEAAPRTAVVLFIEQEHLDVHKDMAEYVAAKGNITKFQTSDDLLIFNVENEFSRQIAEGSAAQKVGYPGRATTHIEDGYFYNGEQKMCSVDILQIPGEHNRSNAIAAIDAVWKYTQDAAAIEKGLHAFKGLPHRLAYVASVSDVAYYDDSIATTPTSAVAALTSFTQPKVIILGGSDKGGDYRPLLIELIKNTSIRAIVSIGANGAAITGMLDDQNLVKVHRVDSKDMNDIVATAASLAQPGDVVILSPAAASFDMFKNYADRGQQFIDAVNKL
ncbi:UDP-N-acetylmuramoyl-L-alanine--D-glutamate ligase [Candidatus Saccharibacteria bacterium]|nr:UDP-N-acetylmuramoyl-L-alanine--D-glutamate ligase [Candidatus Saccharibacteria bacterium]